MAVWIYKLAASYTYQSSLLKDISFESEWGNIRNGVLTIYKGYAWDGCTPKYKISSSRVVGVWDGWDKEDGKPVCYYASLVHDFFCQYKDEINVTKKTTLLIFEEMLKERSWPFTSLYVLAVKTFGPKAFAGDNRR